MELNLYHAEEVHLSNTKPAIKSIKALSIVQPWAECIVSKGKNIENRSWNTAFRGYVAIHASLSKDKDRFAFCKKKYRISLSPDDLDFGVIVGFAEIVDVVTKKDLNRNTKQWFLGDYGFKLKNIVKLRKPVRVDGSLGFWNLKGAPLRKVIEQLSTTQKKRILGNLLSKEK